MIICVAGPVAAWKKHKVLVSQFGKSMLNIKWFGEYKDLFQNIAGCSCLGEFIDFMTTLSVQINYTYFY